MTNREKLNRECIYDLLCRINAEMKRKKAQTNNDFRLCIMDILENGECGRCSLCNGSRRGDDIECGMCIGKWLNSKYDGRSE